MAWQLVFTEQYNRRAARFLKRHPDAIGQYTKTLKLLAANPHHPSLRLHALQGRLSGLMSELALQAARMGRDCSTYQSTAMPVSATGTSEP